jgi:hypothetical protein
MALGGEFAIITSLLMKFDFAWEIKQPTAIAVWEQPYSKTFSCLLAVVRNFSVPRSQSNAVLSHFSLQQRKIRN